MDPRHLPFGHPQIPSMPSSSFQQGSGNFLQNPGVGYSPGGIGGPSAQSSLIMNSWLHHQAQQVSALTGHSAASFPYPAAAASQPIPSGLAARFFQPSSGGGLQQQLDSMSLRGYMTQSLLTAQHLPPEPPHQHLIAQQTQQILRQNAPTPAAVNLTSPLNPSTGTGRERENQVEVEARVNARGDGESQSRTTGPNPSTLVIPHSPMVHHLPSPASQTSPNKVSPMLAGPGRGGPKAPLTHLEQIVSGGMPTFGLPLSDLSDPVVVPPPPSQESHRQSGPGGHRDVSHPATTSAASSSGLFPHSVDALEEALVTLSRDYNLESDLTDLNEHLLRDAFFGSSAAGGHQESELNKIIPEPQTQSSGDGSLLHSILEYDPSTLAAQTSETSEDDHLLESTELSVEKPSHVPPPSVQEASLAPAQSQPTTEGSVVAPKLREKIKMKREKELAEIDKAFDRHLSLVAERNERSSSAAPIPHLNLPPVTPVAPYPNSATHSMSPANSAAGFSGGTPCPSTADRSESVAPLSPVRFSPVQFSPDASDKEDAQFGQKSAFDDPDDDELRVFIPLPDKKTKGNGPKIPIYKQMAGAMGSLKPKLELGVEPVPADRKEGTSKLEAGDFAYEFTDDEEEEEKGRKKSAAAASSIVDQKKEQKLEEEVARKLMQISSLHPELQIPGMSVGGNQGAHPSARNQQGLTRAQQEAVVAAVSRAGFDGRKFQSPQTVAAVQQVINQVTAGVQESNTDLWRHVVPKKRGAKDRNSEGQMSQPSAPLLPPVSAETASNQIQVQRREQEAVPLLPEPKPTALSLAAQLADTLKKRKEKLKEHSFVRTEIILDDDSTAMPSPKTTTELSGSPAAGGGRYMPKQEILPRSEDPIEPLLPKVIIRIPKKNILIKEEPVDEEREHRPHKKHKKKHKKHKHREDEGQEGEGVKKKKKKKKHKHKKEDAEEEARRSERRRVRKLPGPDFTSPSSSEHGDNSEGEDPLWKPSRGSQATEPRSSADKAGGHFSKKKRLMNSLSEAMTEDGDRGSETRTRSFDLEMDEEAANDQRLAQFRQPTGILQKGTFVVLKEDIGKNDCPLWRVDNQNLLQKFPPKDNHNGISYHSSSTNSDQYLVVQVRYLQHTRAESIVEPDIPIVDLFPAVSTEVSGNRSAGPELLCGGALSPPECDQHVPAPTPLPDQPIRDALDTYLHALLLHCLSGNFLQNLRANNEWKFLRHIHDIDSLNGNKKSKLISQVKWDSKFRNLVEWYPLCTIGDTEGAGLSCQACHKQSVEKVVQLFANEAYDFDTLESRPPRRAPSGSPQPSQEYLVCSKCTNVTEIYHKLYHMRYHLFRSCEDKIDFIRDENPTAEPAVIQEQCLRNRSWVNHITSPYLELWNRIS